MTDHPLLSITFLLNRHFALQFFCVTNVAYWAFCTLVLEAVISLQTVDVIDLCVGEPADTVDGSFAVWCVMWVLEGFFFFVSLLGFVWFFAGEWL